MAQLLILTASADTEVLPALQLLGHKFRAIPAEPASLVNAPSADLIFLDARHNLAAAKSIARLLNTTGLSTPLLAVVTEGGLAGISSEWGIADIILDTAGPAEIDARIRLALARQNEGRASEQIQTSGISIDRG
jgi:DNA-binding response OmpR family regulator